MKTAFCVAGLALALAVPAQAKIVTYTAQGALSGVDYGDAAAAVFMTKVPLGTPYSFTFSYDTAQARDSGGPAGSSFYPVDTHGVFSVDGFDMALSNQAGLSTNNGLGGSPPSFSLFTNFAMPAPKLYDFWGIDFRLALEDGKPGAITGLSLPETLALDDFATRYLRLRFHVTDGPDGEAGLFFSITSLRATGAVPEPASWALMIAGFGLAGATVRRAAARRAFA